MPGEGHLEERDEQPAIGAIVVGAQQLRGAQFSQRRRELEQPARLVEIRRLLSDLAVHLRERRGPEAVPAGGEIDEPQRARPLLELERRRERRTHVGDGRERGDDERYGCYDALL